MKRLTTRGTIALLVALSFSPIPASSEPSASAPSTFVVEEYRWAQGRVIDSIYVVGNRKVRDFAVLREMQLREGARFDLSSFERDQRYIGDLGPFASVVIVVEPVGDDRCSLRITVTERPTLLLRLIYPVLDYDFNRNRVRYGLKWNDSNFRSRLENFSVDVTRDNFNNNSAAAQWSSRWVGWKQIGTYVRASYFRREGTSPKLLISEQSRIRFAISAPLRESRIQVSQLLAGLGFANNLLTQQRAVGQVVFEDELLISPNFGYVFDRRDSPLRPHWGDYLFINVTANRVLNGPDRNYYILTNELRFFRPLNESTVIGLQSHIDYQFGEYPRYVRFNVGGAGSVRGYEPSDFLGAHRMFQSLELRISPWAKRFYRLPFVGLSDFLLTMVVFVDGGIAWTHERQFDPHNYHGGYGWGLRLYSPLQNVIRFDMAYDRYGRVRPYVSTGVRF